MGISQYYDTNSPVGAVDERKDYSITGRGGKVRHRGSFSDDNPFLQDLRVAKKNQDIDALYEHAMNWEMMQEQRAYDRSVLEEQREYEDPLNQVARQRAAGINPDLVGGSSGGSGGISSGSSSTQQSLPAPESKTEFDNHYATTDRVFAGINTAMNIVSSISGGFSAITQGINSIKLLSSQKNLMEAQAKLGNSQANEIDTLLSGKKDAQAIQNITNYVGLADKLRGMLDMQFKDDDATSLFSTFGIPADQHSGLIKSIRTLNQRPDLVAKWNKDKVDQRQAESEYKFLDSKFFDKMVDLGKQTELATSLFEKADAIIMSHVSLALENNPNYIDDLVRSEVLDADIAAQGKTLELDNLRRDIKGWGQIWDGQMEALKKADQKLEDMRKTFEADGKWTREEEALYQGFWMERQTIRNMLSDEYASMRNNFINMMQKRYEMNLLNPDGTLANMDGVGAFVNFALSVFDENYQNLPSGGEILRRWITGLGDIAVDAGTAIALKGGKGVSQSVSRARRAFRYYRRSNN